MASTTTSSRNGCQRPGNRPQRAHLVAVAGGRNQPTLVTVAKSELDEVRMEVAVARDERLAHTAAVRQHVRSAIRALADGRFAMAAMWLVELERLNEREAIRARATEVEAKPCPDGIRAVGHGRAA